MAVTSPEPGGDPRPRRTRGVATGTDMSGGSATQSEARVHGPTTLSGLSVWALALVLAAGLSVAGCGPLASSSAISNAEVALSKAEVERAQHFAAYPYWLARRYLEKAKRVEGHSRYTASERFAEQAAVYAEQARVDARESRLRQQMLDERLKQRHDGASTSPQGKP